MVTESFIERTFAFLEKALREAKVETTYDEPNAEYEEACKNFVSSILDDKHSFLESFVPFLQKVIEVGTLYSLAQTVIKITAPGIPDIYQGCELWDVSYVDPDNRRPVDYECRKNNLDEIIKLEKEGADAVLSFIHKYKKEGREKLFATYKTLNLRTANNEVFIKGEYLPLQTNSENVVAYARKKEDKWVVVIVPFTEEVISNETITITLPGGAPTQWQNIFTTQEVDAQNGLSVNEQLKKFPVAVFVAGL